MKNKRTVQHELEKHTEEYIHIRKPALLPFIGIIIFGFLAYLNWQIIDWHTIGIILGDDDAAIASLSVTSLSIVWAAIGQYFLIGAFFISLVAFFKSGYKNLLPIDEGGLLSGLLIGLFGGLFGGLFAGLLGEYQK